MVIKKVNRLCSVKGCKSTQSYAISRSNEYGGVIICKECLNDALNAVNIAEESGKTKLKTKEASSEAPASLFFHPGAAPAKKAAGKAVKDKAKSEVPDA